MPFDPVYRVAELRVLEAKACDAPLMERAGLAAATVARDLLATQPPRVLVLAGPGNNGGDAFVVARWLKSWFFDVNVVFHADAGRLPAGAANAYRAWLGAGGTTIAEMPERGDWGLIVDGLFGIGLTRAVEGAYAQWIERANTHRAPILALDIPSGLNADTGVAMQPAIRAAATATFIALKPGLLTGDGPDYCGALSVHDLNLDAAAFGPPAGRRLEWRCLRRALPESLRRSRHNVHKGTFGTLAIVGGNNGMVGAAILAGRAALYLGAGKVFVGLATAARPAVDWVQPELMLRDAARVFDPLPDALVVGPGFGTHPGARALLAKALPLGLRSRSMQMH